MKDYTHMLGKDFKELEASCEQHDIYEAKHPKLGEGKLHVFDRHTSMFGVEFVAYVFSQELEDREHLFRGVYSTTVTKAYYEFEDLMSLQIGNGKYWEGDIVEVTLHSGRVIIGEVSLADMSDPETLHTKIISDDFYANVHLEPMLLDPIDVKSVKVISNTYMEEK